MQLDVTRFYLNIRSYRYWVLLIRTGTSSTWLWNHMKSMKISWVTSRITSRLQVFLLLFLRGHDQPPRLPRRTALRQKVRRHLGEVHQGGWWPGDQRMPSWEVAKNDERSLHYDYMMIAWWWSMMKFVAKWIYDGPKTSKSTLKPPFIWGSLRLVPSRISEVQNPFSNTSVPGCALQTPGCTTKTTHLIKGHSIP